MDENECPGPGEVWPARELELVRESIVRDAMEDLDRPHIVLIRDGRLDLTLVMGPFPDALTATVAAHGQRLEDDRELGESQSRTYAVFVLLPPVSVAV
ncbi:hypothetical protein [Nocardioides sp. AN3]